MAFSKDPRKYYLNEMHSKFGSFATWPANINLHLGDVGILKNNEFKYWTRLDNLGIDFKKIDVGFKTDINWASRAGVETYSKFLGKGVPDSLPFAKINADITIYIQKANTIYCNFPKIRSCKINDLNSLAYKLIDRYKNNYQQKDEKKWNLDWVVITELQYAEKGTILLSNSDESYVALTAVAGAKQVDIINLNCSFANKGYKGIEIKLVAEDGITPLFNVMQIKKNIIQRLGTIRRKRPVNPGEPGYEEYVRNLPIIDYTFEKVEFQPYSKQE